MAKLIIQLWDRDNLWILDHEKCKARGILQTSNESASALATLIMNNYRSDANDIIFGRIADEIRSCNQDLIQTPFHIENIIRGVLNELEQTIE